MKSTQPHLYHDQTRLARWIKILAAPYLLGLLGVLAIDCYKLPYLNDMLAMLSNPEFDYFAAEYAFAQHKGYPTKLHLEKLAELGALPQHRRSFTPVKKILETKFTDK